MSSNLRIVAAFGLLLIAAIAGIFFSGQLILMLLKVAAPLSVDTYWSYVKALDLPQFAPYASKIKLAGAIGFGVPLLAWIALLIPLFKPKAAALHGDARFASGSDLAKKDMLKPSPTGIVVGKHGGKVVRLPGQQFVILAAPTRSGKGVGIVIPNLLDYQGSVVVLDIKQENFDLTSGWRKSQGQEVFLFNPFAEDGRTHRWNPLSYISPDPAFRVSDLMSVAAMLYPDGSDAQKFWVSQARNAFMAFTLYLFDSLDDQIKREHPKDTWMFPTLGMLYRVSSGDGSDLKGYLKKLSQRDFLGRDAKTAFDNLLSQAEETFASIMGTFKEPLNQFINPILDASTSDNDFLLTDVRKKKMSIYIGIQPNKLAESRLLINLLFSQLINLNTKELPQNNPALKHQCLLLMDEFTSIGRVDIIASAVSYMAGYNIRLLPIIQSMAQLDATYGKDVSRTIITNHALQIVYAPREQQDANDYSDMLGYTTVRKKNKSQTSGKQSSVSYSETEQRRALMLPQELKAMGFDKEVFLYEGIPSPVLCEKIKYYEDAYFTKRLLPKAEVKALMSTAAW
ncbi:type IV secretory system conjugative DNA transfer family protein [Xanthomonas campestris pv. campestris]|uniref:type IV secretory system conjugative DNA transfer family protein n=2 Tax=Xanthomonas campestris TaxID=339 RepID=UPI0005DBBDC5|nr:type IV secretory system conjugative DNA transfer family protein [Xanthomonas campestris]MCC3254656.1 type IV secretory system conjugative DNA transfer family protein [Xanthomonas campestris pv. armoraciae]MCC5051010.1 type IV secretory system conjugative DNA transfer family protein [Xanthomonas campestris pv. aberrans]MCF8797655.1 type IV secretory system conjugative DNA transfer family protein [Xanthomonas campestris pv. campestris]MCF8815136.1 type IV secretory system conjugative DNA tran